MQITPPEIESYCINNSDDESPICAEIAAYTYAHVPIPQMMIGPLEAAFLCLLIKTLQAKRILEIGCFTGYSALAMAQALPADGKVITLDINEANVEIAKSFWKKSPHGSKIQAIVGDAADSLIHMSGLFDLIFIDADKRNYQNYFDSCLKLLAPNGLIAMDNCLWGGAVLAESIDKDTQAIQAFNEHISNRKDLQKSLIPVRDGIYLIRKN